MLILDPVSSRDLVKDIPPISLVIMGALRSLFLTGKEFIMIELTVLLSWILFGVLWGVHIPFRNLAYEGICLMASIKGMVMVTFCRLLRSITFQNFDQNIKCSGKTLNRTFKIPSHQEQMILSSSMYEKTYLQGFLEGVLEAIQVSSL